MDDRQLADAVADSLSSLANPLRVHILLALADTRQPDWDHRGMSYSELRSAVGVEDGGRFNYHLDELRDRFVEKADDRYRLTVAGVRIVNEVHAGSFTYSSDRIEGTLRYECPVHGDPLRAAFENGVFTADCPEHGRYFDMSLPPTAAERGDLDELYELAIKRNLRYLESVTWDFCPHCGGRFEEPMVEHANEPPWSSVLIGHACSNCGVAFRVPVENYTLFRPPTIAFFHDHGIDNTSAEPYTTCLTRFCEVTEREDDFLVRYEYESEYLELDVDRSLSVLEARRGPLE